MGEEKPKPVLRLDGSHGLGVNCHVTIVTADKVLGEKEVTYELPYAIVKKDILDKAVDSQFILGYGIKKIINKDGPTVVFTENGVHLDQGDENE